MIFIGADHGGFELKKKIVQWLDERHLPYTDVGAHTFDAEDDYPAFAFAVAEGVAKAPAENRGILACRSAAGVVIAANKVVGVRAVAPFSVEAAHHSREHNDANVLGLSGDWLTDEQAHEMLFAWLDTPFSNEERHVRRVQQITEYEKNH